MDGGSRLLAGLVVAVALLAGCADDGGGPGTSGDAACALTADFRGVAYDGTDLAQAPEKGDVVGEAVYPPCNDTNDADEKAERFSVSRIRGVDPDVAVMATNMRSRVFVRQGAEMPEEIAALVGPPPCDPSDAPIHMLGQWYGILGADGNTELDLEPPYDLEVSVEESEPEGYGPATLSIRVPTALGQPLTKRDVRTSLWQGGNIEVTASCRNGGFVAESVRALPG